MILCLISVSLPLAGIEEHLMVHREVVDRDLTRQFAHPCRHPYHPIQHDPDKGTFVLKSISCRHFYSPIDEDL